MKIQVLELKTEREFTGKEGDQVKVYTYKVQTADGMTVMADAYKKLDIGEVEVESLDETDKGFKIKMPRAGGARAAYDPERGARENRQHGLATATEFIHNKGMFLAECVKLGVVDPEVLVDYAKSYNSKSVLHLAALWRGFSEGSINHEMTAEAIAAFISTTPVTAAKQDEPAKEEPKPEPKQEELKEDKKSSAPDGSQDVNPDEIPL